MKTGKRNEAVKYLERKELEYEKGEKGRKREIQAEGRHKIQNNVAEIDKKRKRIDNETR